MDVEARPPAPPLAAAGQDGPARRSWPWILAALAVILLVLTAIGAAWLANVEPLGPGSTVIGPLGVRFSSPYPPPRVRARSVNAFGVSGTVLLVPASPGMRFTYDVTIRNDARFPVEIVDVGSGPGPQQVARHVVAAQPDHPGGEIVDPEPFRPFMLDAGEQAGLVIEVRVSDDPCVTEPGSILWSSQPVTFRVFGFPGFRRFQSVDTGTEIRLVGHGPGC